MKNFLHNHFLKILFCLGFPLAVFWNSMMVFTEVVREGEVASLVIALLTLLLFLWYSYRRHPDFLKLHPEVGYFRLAKILVLSGAAAYLIFAIVYFILGGIYIYFTLDQWTNEAAILQWWIAIWMPLWWIIPGAAWFTWKRLRVAT